MPHLPPISPPSPHAAPPFRPNLPTAVHLSQPPPPPQKKACSGRITPHFARPGCTHLGRLGSLCLFSCREFGKNGETGNQRVLWAEVLFTSVNRQTGCISELVWNHARKRLFVIVRQLSKAFRAALHRLFWQGSGAILNIGCLLAQWEDLASITGWAARGQCCAWFMSSLWAYPCLRRIINALRVFVGVVTASQPRVPLLSWVLDAALVAVESCFSHFSARCICST